jgi:hypothetical protein
MKEKWDAMTRRDFMRGTAYAGLGAVLGLGADTGGKDDMSGTAKVILIRDEHALTEDLKPNAEVLQKMLDRAVGELLNEKDVSRAWKMLVRPSDIVGIKTNVWGKLHTPKELEEAMQRRLLEAGIGQSNIRIDDREALKRLGDCTALINVRPLRTHHWAGVGGCIKNYIMFVPKPFEYHDDVCADLGAIWNLPIVKGKTKLNVLVMLTPQFYGKGPHNFDDRYVWDYRGLLVSTDPVAVDAAGVSILEAKRRIYFNEDRPLKPLTKHIAYAETRHKIGISDMSRITIVKVGSTKDILI